MQTTVGQILINENLPEEMRDYKRIYDKKLVTQLLEEVAREHPTKYKDIVHKLMNLGRNVSTTYGRSASFSLSDMEPPAEYVAIRNELRNKISNIINDRRLTPETRNRMIIESVGDQAVDLRNLNFELGLRDQNPFALQILSGARGNPNQFASMRIGDIMSVDHRDDPIPIPILTGYAEGLSPVEYWANTYGTRKGAVAQQVLTPESGFAGKELALSSHKLIISEKDCGTERGIPIDVTDKDSVGALLARDYGDFKANTPLDLNMLNKLKKEKTIFIRSPITCEADNGICQKCAGIRERGTLPALGENIGVTAATAFAEPLTQAPISAKHSGGIVGSGLMSGFDAIKRMIDIPKNFPGSAVLSEVDGVVNSIQEAPQGGHYVLLADQKYYVPDYLEVTVKSGDTVEPGDKLSEGISHPAQIARLKGIGVGRLQYMNELTRMARESNIKSHRRNMEILARGLVNHVRVTGDDIDDAITGDIREFDSIVRHYQPREGFATVTPNRAIGSYLEQPVNQYSIGTRISKSMAKDLEKGGVRSLLVHQNPPSFEPAMQRAMENLSYSDDWMTRMAGWYLKRGLLDAAQTGMESPSHGPSFVHPLAMGTEFGRVPKGKGY